MREGVITTSWHQNEAETLTADTEIFRITFKAKANAQLIDLLSIGSRYTFAEAYGKTANISSAELLDVTLRFENGEESGKFALHQNIPNPFREETVIGFELPEASAATVTITDVKGKVMKQYSGKFDKGFNQITVLPEQLGSTGIYFYQLTTADHVAVKKLILIK